MSLRLERFSTPATSSLGDYEESINVRWAEEVAVICMPEELSDKEEAKQWDRHDWANDSNGSSISSISSEEETGLQHDSEGWNRMKTSDPIWNDDTIWSKLQGEDVIQSIENGDVSDITSKNKKTTMLISTWKQRKDILKILLDHGAPLAAVDEDGRSALHLAAYVGNTDCLKLLLQNGARYVNVTDYVKNITPLHCAASKGRLGCMKLLIEHKADVNAGLSDNRSPLHYAVQSRAVECVKELLENKAVPNTPQVFSETPLHIAAAMGATDTMALLLSHGAAVDVQYGPDKLTPLHLAAEDGDAQCARLLVDHGAKLTSRNNKQQTPLHLAALGQCSETLELLLTRGANPNARDQDGRTPLHCAIVKVSRSCECLRHLLNSGADVNMQDNFGYTPLHLAALNEFSGCVMMLLEHGGDVTIRTNGGVSVLTFITRKTPDVIPEYLRKFDASIKVNDHEIGDVDCELKLDFRILVPAMGHKETELLLNFIEVGHREILKHPLCETFLFLKWRRIRKFFLFSLFYHTLFVLLFSMYVIGVFQRNCPAQKVKNINMCQVQLYIQIFGYILLCLNVMLMGKEVFQICHSWRIYVKEWENWLQWLIIISVFCSVQPTKHSMNVRLNVADWQHHVAAIGIFLSWLELMMIVGRFPIFGLYIQMFTTVSINFIKFVASYFCLLIAFGLSFGVLFANYKPLQDLKWVIIKVIVMMSGELEYEDMFYDDKQPITYNWTAQIMFLAFVILVTIILTNLTVGMAVSDIQGLQQSAGLDRLVRQAELVAHLESMLFSRLFKCIPPKIMRLLHKRALLLKSQYHWALYIKPNDPREERIPKELIKSIYHSVVERKEKPRSRKRNNYAHNSNKTIHVMSPSLSRMNSNYSDSSLPINHEGSRNSKGHEHAFAKIEEIQRELVEFHRRVKHKLEQLAEIK